MTNQCASGQTVYRIYCHNKLYATLTQLALAKHWMATTYSCPTDQMTWTRRDSHHYTWTETSPGIWTELDTTRYDTGHQIRTETYMHWTSQANKQQKPTRDQLTPEKTND